MMLSAVHHDDMAARRLALTALDRTMLVEAGAGSGKTSILAGRVVALLAAGRPPGTIAAITFTELAASELRERIAAFLDELIEGRVRPDLEPAFGTGCTGEQRQTLAAVRADLDQLTCCTIHSFCQTLLTPYPVEADMDPGAAVMDRVAADVLFSEVFDDVLRERLSVAQDPNDLLVAMFLADPGATRGLLEGIAAKLRGRPDLRFPPEVSGTEPLGTLRASVVAFRHFLDGAPCQEAGTEAIVAGLEALRADLPFGSGPSPAALIRMLRLSAPACCAKQDGGFRAYQAKGRWRAAAKASRSVTEAERLNDQATECYLACAEAHAAVRAWAATRVLRRLGEDCRTVVERFAQAKRDRAQLDFDDLILKSRDLLARRADVRRALNKRFACILVDEFQDTDSMQCEILWRLAGNPPEGVADARWDAWDLQPGSLFLVGDPKQAIYRFRGADVASYLGVRDLLHAKDRASVVSVAQNFRSVHGILEWVNRHFEGPLRAEGQPGFAHLFAAAGGSDAASVASFDIEVDSTKADVIRDAEAEAVAALCDRLIGSLEIRGRDGARLCAPDDIALLAPSGTDLWRYERALEERGIAVSTQAGKGFFRRQEVQDLIALTRILADGRDTLALGAFVRGPMVGLTEEDLLDVAAALPREAGELPRLQLWTPVEHIAHALLRDTLAILQGLAKRASSTTPYILLCRTVEELQVRPIVRSRRPRTAERALANVDAYLELVRPFDLQGLKATADSMRRQWEEATRAMEARPDTQRRAVSLITMHSSKGLEWPVVVPINTATEPKKHVGAVLERRTGTLHLPVLGVHPIGTLEAIEAEKAELARERTRIWYVAATRARDLLILPKLSCGPPKSSWMAMMSAGIETIERWAPLTRGEDLPRGVAPGLDGPDRATFEAQAVAIVANAHVLTRTTPHLAEVGDEPLTEAEVLADDAEAFGSDAKVNSVRVRGSRTRGLILHKLLEEVLTGERPESGPALSERAAELAAELAGKAAETLDCAELATSVLRGLTVPEVAAVRHALIPECWVSASHRDGRAENVVIGIADAVALDRDGGIGLVIDWKSDVAPKSNVVSQYRGQIRSYLDATGATEGLIVFLTTGQVERVRPIDAE